jgi:hypothetical protein
MSRPWSRSSRSRRESPTAKPKHASDLTRRNDRHDVALVPFQLVVSKLIPDVDRTREAAAARDASRGTTPANKKIVAGDAAAGDCAPSGTAVVVCPPPP